MTSKEVVLIQRLEIAQLKTKIEKLEKFINILGGRICLHNGYICYDAYADSKLTDDEIKIFKGVLND